MNRDCPQCGRLLKEFQTYDKEPICRCDREREIQNEKIDEVISLLQQLLSRNL